MEPIGSLPDECSNIKYIKTSSRIFASRFLNSRLCEDLIVLYHVSIWKWTESKLYKFRIFNKERQVWVFYIFDNFHPRVLSSGYILVSKLHAIILNIICVQWLKLGDSSINLKDSPLDDFILKYIS